MVATLGKEHSYHTGCCYLGIIADRNCNMLHNYMYLPSPSAPG